jgi:hypothetical protein
VWALGAAYPPPVSFIAGFTRLLDRVVGGICGGR